MKLTSESSVATAASRSFFFPSFSGSSPSIWNRNYMLIMANQLHSCYLNNHITACLQTIMWMNSIFGIFVHCIMSISNCEYEVIRAYHSRQMNSRKAVNISTLGEILCLRQLIRNQDFELKFKVSKQIQIIRESNICHIKKKKHIVNYISPRLFLHHYPSIFHQKL